MGIPKFQAQNSKQTRAGSLAAPKHNVILNLVQDLSRGYIFTLEAESNPGEGTGRLCITVSPI